jgi:hypothetical protein
MKRHLNTIALLLATAMTLSLSACDSNDDEGGVPISAETSAAMAETVEGVFSVIPLALSEAQLAKLQAEAKTADPAGACPEGGAFTVTGSASATQSSFDVDVEVDFEDCNGINGSLALDGGGSISETSFAFDLVLDGTVARECSLTFDGFRESAVADFTTSEMTLTLDGSFAGACTGEGFTCSFNDVDVDPAAGPPTELMQQACRLN